MYTYHIYIYRIIIHYLSILYIYIYRCIYILQWHPFQSSTTKMLTQWVLRESKNPIDNESSELV